MLRVANLALLILLPVAWFAPILRAGMLPLFGLSEISIVSGLQSLWETDAALALLVTALAIFVPWLKVLGLALVQFGLLNARVMPVLHLLGRLSMTDVFLVALYIVVVKGAGMARIETAWGLYLFTGCVLASIALGWATPHPRTGCGTIAPGGRNRH